MLMLDCKNTAPCYYPRIYPDQLQFSPEDRVDARKDLWDGVYYAADIYALSTRAVTVKEQRVLKNRMEWILTGGEEHLQDSEALGREAGVQKQDEAAQMRMQGTKRVKKRKGKRSNFYKRPDRTQTEKRKTLSYAKTE